MSAPVWPFPFPPMTNEESDRLFWRAHREHTRRMYDHLRMARRLRWGKS